MLINKSWLAQLKQRLTNPSLSGRSRARRVRRSSVESLESRQLLSASPVGPEFLVNTATANQQSAVSMAMDADGDFVVAWQSFLQDGSSYGVYAQRYNASGVAQLGEFRVNTTTADIQGAPSVAMDADGDYVVTWQSDLQDGSGYGIYAQRYNMVGVMRGGEFRVNTTTASHQFKPSVAMDADGDFVVTWHSLGQDGSGYGIYAQRYNGTGVAQGSEFQVNTFTANNQSYPSVAMDADGDFVVTWTSVGQDGSGNGVYAQRYNAAGVTQGGEFQVNTFTANAQNIGSVAMDADGDFVVTWYSYLQDGSHFGIYAQCYNAAGVTQGGEFRVNTTTANWQGGSSVAMDADGDFVVTWESLAQDGNGFGIYAQRYNAAGVAQGGEFQVNTFLSSDQIFPSVAMDADGDFVVTWHSNLQDGSAHGIYAQRYNAAGVTQGGEFQVNTTTASIQRDPSVAMDADGDFVVTLSSNLQDASGYGIYAQRYRLDAPVQLATGVLSLTGTNLADVMDVKSVTPAGSTAYLNVVRNGVNYIIDLSRVVSITMNGLSGNDLLTVANTVTARATLVGGGGNDVLTGGGGNDTLLGGSGNDIYVFDTDTALGSDILTDSSGIDTFDFNATTGNAVAVSLGITTTQVVHANLSLKLSAGNSIENVIGGSLGDTLTGNSLANSLTGGGGDDTLIGGSGNDTYLFNTDIVLGTDTINDASGTDTLDFSATTIQTIVADLSSAVAQTVTTGNLVLTLSAGNSIENAIGGALNDILTANSLSNTLTGGAGNDTYMFDTDTASGSDTINDATGTDTLSFSATTTTSVAVNLATATAQVVNANLTLTLSSATALENVTGGALGDTLTGNTLANSLTGGGGDDALTGGAGNDSYLFDTDLVLGTDTINESGGDIDTLDFSATTTQSIAIDLSNAVAQVVTASNLTLILSSGTTLENAIGGSLDDTLTGNTLANSLTGGGGSDTLTGGSENDTYLFDTALVLGTDTINESGGGIDTLDFSATTTQSIAIDLSNAAAQVVTAARLTLILSSGTTLERAIGGSLGDTLTGNTLANSLTGGEGDDTLTGQSGNDTYRFDTDLALGTDTINESGGGTDTLNFALTTTRTVSVDLSSAGAQVVNAGLTLILSAGNTLENVIGGSLADTLTGNTLANSLTGGGGNDLLTGGAGNDTYLFDTDLVLGTDTVNETGGGIDTLTGNTLANSLTGGGGNDLLAGGSGDDTYVFDTDLALGSDTIIETGVGIDKLDFGLTTTREIVVDLSIATPQIVNAGLTLTLSAINTIENATGGSLNDILIGNSLANTLTGNDGDDVLSGRAGNDILIGGTGKNILIGGDGADQLTGGISEDLLLGARYIYENDLIALDSLRAEWISASSFDDRVGHLLGTLAGGVHNGFTLTRSTVKEDSSADTLTGGSGRDWYLRNSLGLPAIFRDTVTDADLDSVFTEIDSWL